jgi:hypothetical protein
VRRCWRIAGPIAGDAARDGVDRRPADHRLGHRRMTVLSRASRRCAVSQADGSAARRGASVCWSFSARPPAAPDLMVSRSSVSAEHVAHTTILDLGEHVQPVLGTLSARGAGHRRGFPGPEPEDVATATRRWRISRSAKNACRVGASALTADLPSRRPDGLRGGFPVAVRPRPSAPGRPTGTSYSEIGITGITPIPGLFRYPFPCPRDGPVACDDTLP